MQTGYYSSAAGMVTQFNRLDTIANNLANVNTAGFKEDNLVVGDFMRIYKEKRDELSLDNNTKEGAQFLNRTLTRVPQIVDSFTDQSVGTLQKTSNTLDFALSREGLFFAVKTPDGVRLTRDGSFSKNDEGKLVTKQGYEVLPNDYFGNISNGGISVTADDSIISVDKNGQISTNIPNTSQFIGGAKFFIAQPDNINLLKKEGDNLYKLEDIKNLTSLEDSGAVSQGFIEKSNVNAVKMMTQLIETNRLVGMYQKAMSAQMDDMNRDAIEKLAKKA
ncbi:MAG: flagellar hook-basal body protein [Sulfurimonas sp.]